MIGTTEQFWNKYYSRIMSDGKPWLDYSNERIQLQTLGLSIEAAGQLLGRRCLDIGCGLGQLSLTLSDLRAKSVTAVDIVEPTIQKLARDHPQVEWVAGSILEPALLERLGTYELIFLMETLQYVSSETLLPLLWDKLGGGGRIVIVVPNTECPIVKEVIQRFQGNYAPPSIPLMARILDSLPNTEFWAFRGFFFQEDQRIVPYLAAPWTQKRDWASEPNRLQYVVQKRKS
jgi:2-polyprenyl-3-methyl-5-hydroxy-6-metoxy-1,4-benzoquinol methylase